MMAYAWLIPIFPLLAFLLIAAFGRRWREGGGWVAVGASFLSFIFSVPVVNEALRGRTLELGHTWFIIGPFQFNLGIYVDSLTALMLVVVSLISFLIALYSIGYMGHEGVRKPRYYAEISLFIGSMLGLVLANNYLELYIFWEFVGLCSYLLIGFWFERPAAAAAALKAFIVTRLGDLFFLFGLVLIYLNFGTFNFMKLFHMEFTPDQTGLLKVVTFLIFMGAVGKSAQFPLHIWFPDAMEGPSTVSALIHAATMVKAGVYLVARSYPLFVQTPETILLVAGIGGFTALFTATMALVNNDIKRVLAFSTISQLGYMMLGLGAGGYLVSTGLVEASAGYSAAMFHLLNHAFFKALLFLGAGAVMHGLHDELDIRKMGGLARKMPITAATMLIAALAISGIPPFSGFWSKDAVLEAVFAAGEHHGFLLLLWLFGVITAFLTAFYMFRWWFLVFGGRPRYEGEPHEAPAIMTGPLVVLAGFATVTGVAVFELPKLVHFGELHVPPPVELLHEIFTNPLTYLSLGLALAGILLAWAVYQREWLRWERISTPFGRWLHQLLLNRYYLNDAYISFARTCVYGFSVFIDLFDRYVIDGIVNLIGWTSRGIGQGLRRTVTGFVGDYAAWIVAGLVVILLIYIFGRAF